MEMKVLIIPQWYSIHTTGLYKLKCLNYHYVEKSKTTYYTGSIVWQKFNLRVAFALNQKADNELSH